MPHDDIVIRDLRARLHEAEETIRQLRENVRKLADTPPFDWPVLNLAPSERRIMAFLLRSPGVVPRDRLAVAASPDNYWASRDTVKVVICRLRRKLKQRAPEGVTIRTSYDGGYFMPPASKEALMRAIP